LVFWLDRDKLRSIIAPLKDIYGGRMPAVAILGRIGYDLYAEDHHVPLERVRHFRSGVGGSSANIAVGLARLGFEVHMIGAVSDDALGRFLLDNLSAEKVDVSFVQPVSGHNVSLCLTEVSPPDNFHQVFYRSDPADVCVVQSGAQEQAIRKSQVFVTNGTSLCANPSRETTLQSLRIAREAALTTVFDVDFRASSWRSKAEAGRAAVEALKWVDVVLANSDEMNVLAAGLGDASLSEEQVAARCLACGVRWVAWKQGASGATWFSRDGETHVHAFPVPVTSTIGAGDGFATGFIYAYAQGKALVECARYANACAACVVHEVGCADAMPTLEVLERQLHKATAGSIP
jgi:5-dehydro-2-deoxygluconokinase